MTTHGPFLIDEREIRFVLFEHLEVDALFGRAHFAAASRDDAELMLKEGWRFAKEKIWPTNAVADREGCRFEAGKVTVPPSLKALWKEYAASGWQQLTAKEEYGGASMPSSFGIGVAEAIVGANIAFNPYSGLTRGVARLLDTFGDEVVKRHIVPKLFAGEWAGTMCLTEPHAGTAVGDLKTTATKNDRGTYSMRGTKIFITGGEQDLTEQIVHLVLARTPDAPRGIKGVSLFLVPKYRVKEDGSLGAKNDVACTGIEEKLGFHGSATCALSFGDNDACEGWLIGKEHKGIEVMFHLMNEARIGTGLHGLAAGALAYQLALAYAKERVQGVELDQLKDVDAPRVVIAQHPDVKRMLFTMKAKVDGMRALLFKATFLGDDAATNPDEEAAAKSEKLLELLTPLCKSHCSDTGFDVSVMAMQTFGGAGYTQDHPVEQVLRDVKIASIYEGANGIQALDLIGRKLSKNHGELFFLLMAEIDAALEACGKTAALGDVVERIGEVKELIGRATARIAELGLSGKTKSAALYASPYLTALAQLVTSWLLLEQAAIAERALDGGALGDDARRFYANKVATARFYAKSLLPEAEAHAKKVLAGDDGILDATL